MTDKNQVSTKYEEGDIYDLPNGKAVIYKNGQFVPYVEKTPTKATGTGGLVNKAERILGITGRALTPPALAATAGAAAGLPFAGVGALPGAIAGLGAYELTQLADYLGTTARNAYRGFKGEEPVQSGSQAVEQLLTKAGFPEPSGTGENLLYAAEKGATGALSTQQLAKALAGQMAAQPKNILAGQMPMRTFGQASTPQKIAEVMAQQPQKQAIGGGLAGATSQMGREMGLSEPTSAIMGLGAGMTPFMSAQQFMRTRPTLAQQQARSTATAQPTQTTAQPARTMTDEGMPISQARERNVAMLASHGIPVSPAQTTGNPAAQTMESVLKYIPTSAARSAKFLDTQLRAFTKAALKYAGVNSETADPETLIAANKTFDKEYTDLEGRTVLGGNTDKLIDALDNIERSYRGGFTDSMTRVFNSYRDQILDYAAGNPKGLKYKDMQSQLAGESRSAERSTEAGSGKFKSAIDKLRIALADHMEQSSGKDVRDSWRDVNKRYAIFSQIQDAMDTTDQQVLNSGFISPKILARVVKNQSQSRWIKNDPYVQDFTNLTKAGAGILPDPIPNSGTAQRQFMQDIATGGRQMMKNPMAALAAGTAQTGGSILGAVDPLVAGGVPNVMSRFWYNPKSPSVLYPSTAAILPQTATQREKAKKTAKLLAK